MTFWWLEQIKQNVFKIILFTKPVSKVKSLFGNDFKLLVKLGDFQKKHRPVEKKMLTFYVYMYIRISIQGVLLKIYASRQPP